jgi:hypothetical protein
MAVDGICIVERRVEIDDETQQTGLEASLCGVWI